MTPRPNAIHEVFAYLRVSNTAEAMRFYAQAFGAVEKFRLTEPSGRIGHAEMQFGPAVLMLPADQFYGERGCRLRDPFGHTWITVHEIEKLTPQEMQRRFEAMVE